MKYWLARTLVAVAFHLIFAANIPAQSNTLWTEQSSGTSEALVSVSFAKSNQGIAVGTGGTILTTADAGLNWAAKGFDPDLRFNEVFMFDDISAFAVGFGPNLNFEQVVLRTQDGGENWQSLDTGTTGFMSTVFFLSPDTGFVAGFFNPQTPAISSIQVILRTTNGGDNWELYPDYAANYHFSDIFCNSAGECMAVGLSATLATSSLFTPGILYSANRGDSWTALDSGVQGVDARLGGFNGLNDICWVAEGTWVAVGGTPERNGRILRTTNEGLNWSAQETPVPLTAVTFASSLVGIAVGKAGTILRTADGGVVWETQESTTTEILTDIAFSGDNTWIVVGDNGTILQSQQDSTIVTSVESVKNLPSKFELTQNYPNPFNPTTRIKYTIETPGFVTLKIYNLVGEEIKTLVNEHQSPSSYIFDFDASEFSSGVYFYTLSINGNFLQSKKMLFLQ